FYRDLFSQFFTEKMSKLNVALTYPLQRRRLGGMSTQGEFRFPRKRDLKSKASLAQMRRRRA
ncbi:MAG: hypothetical protein KKF10_05575, partial [Verrucomicrobia bacterium]|nr:hypothetical protein [Verrucomicrobiota bacterium]